MNNRKKIMKIVTIILVATLGVFAIKNYVIAPSGGFKWTTPLDVILLLPAMPFLFIDLPLEPAWLTAALVFGGASIFWLLVGYGIGYWIDKRK